MFGFGNAKKEKLRIFNLRAEMEENIKRDTQRFFLDLKKRNKKLNFKQQVYAELELTNKMMNETFDRSKNQPYPSEWNYWLNRNTSALGMVMAYEDSVRKKRSVK